MKKLSNLYKGIHEESELSYFKFLPFNVSHSKFLCSFYLTLFFFKKLEEKWKIYLAITSSIKLGEGNLGRG
jgi:hypothetical protein